MGCVRDTPARSSGKDVAWWLGVVERGSVPQGWISTVSLRPTTGEIMSRPTGTKTRTLALTLALLLLTAGPVPADIIPVSVTLENLLATEATFRLLEKQEPGYLKITITDATWDKELNIDVLEPDGDPSDLVRLRNQGGKAVLYFGSDDESGNLETKDFPDPNVSDKDIVIEKETVAPSTFKSRVNGGKASVVYTIMSDVDPGGGPDAVSDSITLSAVTPEPGSLLLLSTGAAALGLWIRRRRGLLPG
jgi:hypothetical protein